MQDFRADEVPFWEWGGVIATRPHNDATSEHSLQSSLVVGGGREEPRRRRPTAPAPPCAVASALRAIVSYVFVVDVFTKEEV